MWLLSAEISLTPFPNLLLEQDVPHGKGAMVKNHLRATLGYLGFSRQPKVTLLFSKQSYIPKDLYFSVFTWTSWRVTVRAVSQDPIL